jgi:hypothetical protein
MKIVLLAVLLVVFYTPLTTGLSKKKETNTLKECMNQRYSYTIETDLSISEFCERFCERLRNKYNWSVVYAEENIDEIYTFVCTFQDDKNNNWICKLKIRK